MKKYGKYEKMPDGTRAKQPEPKSILLQTYFTSLISLVLCVTMFFGTTFAWFTSEVENNGNEIYIGTLDVELEKKDGDTSWVPLSADGNKLYTNAVRWEPGYTSLETLRVVDKGNLAFGYTLSFTAGGGTDTRNQDQQLTDDQLKAVAAYFDVWVYSVGNDETKIPNPTNYAAITAADSGWTKIGTLADVLGGRPVFGGVMEEAEVIAQEETAHYYTLALHMNGETATDTEAINALMGKKMILNVKLVAYQRNSEKDSFDDRYDQTASTADQLADALQNGGTVALTADIQLENNQITVPEGVTATLDLNGHHLTGKGGAGTSLLINKGNLTVAGEGKIAIAQDGREDNSKAVNAISNHGVLTVNGGEISNTGTGSQIGYAIDNYNGAVLTVNGGKITASGSNYYDGIRLFCGGKETVVTVNGGEVSSIWAQNPSVNKATEVKGTVIVNGGTVAMVYYENYTTVKVATDVNVTVTPYGVGNDKTNQETKDGYEVYSFVHA